jgi:hypothetical protein
LKLGRDVRFGVDGVDWAFVHASHAIDALLWVNEKLTLHLIEAGDWAHCHAIGELAPHTFTGNDMGHKQIYLLGVALYALGRLGRRVFKQLTVTARERLRFRWREHSARFPRE